MMPVASTTVVANDAKQAVVAELVAEKVMLDTVTTAPEAPITTSITTLSVDANPKK